jgi:dihydroflavonol-4-reductase
MNETVLVTGGTGFVGGWCMVELLKRGYRVRTTVRSLAREAGVRAAVGTEVDPRDRLSFHIADLTGDVGWDAAVAGCDYVLHVASPMGADDGEAQIAAARDGSLRVLKAAITAGVKRVVVTSSTAAAAAPLSRRKADNDETNWTDLKQPNINAYRRSKVIAERAVWDHMAANPGATELTTVLPTAIFGPVLSKDTHGSVQMISRLLSGRMPGYPQLGFSVVDVRDLAVAHVLAMTSPQAPGQRFIAAGDFLWMGDIARILRERLGARAAKVPTRQLPNTVLKVLALGDPGIRALIPQLGNRHSFSADKARRMLGWSARPGEETVVDCAESLIAHGLA